MALVAPGAAELGAGTCSAGASLSEEEGASALQVRRERGSDDDEEMLQRGLATLQRANQTSGVVVTTSIVLATVVTTLTKVAVAKMVQLAFEYLTGPDNFQKAVGPFGLPLSIGIINDTPEPVLYSGFQLRDGSAWGFPALKNHIQPGEMMQWFLYTETSQKVEATMLFQSGDTNWGIAIANYRLGHWFTGCDRLRCNAVADSNMTAALDELCWSNGGAHGAGIRRQGSFKLTILLGEVLQRLRQEQAQRAGSAAAAGVDAEEPRAEAPTHKSQPGAGLLAVDTTHRALQQANQTSQFIITSATIVTTLVGTVTAAAIRRAFSYFSGWDEFQWAVGLTGLPLTIGVINDTPEPVQYADFRLGDGAAWGYPALLNQIQPGEMMQWFLYTQTSAVEVTMLFQAGSKSWSIGAAQYRYGNLFTGCDRLRSKAVLASSMDTALEGLCTSDGGNAEAVHVQGGYQLIVLLSKIGAR